MEKDILQKLKEIKAFVLDIDGVLTDGTVLVTESGELLRNMNIKDGYALKHAVNKGITIAIISGGNSEGTRKRLAGLGIKHIYLGHSDKVNIFHTFLKENDLTAKDICYLGDDMPDIPLLKLSNISVCPADAVTDVINVCDYVSPYKGGKGCVRDILEIAMRLQDKWY